MTEIYYLLMEGRMVKQPGWPPLYNCCSVKAKTVLNRKQEASWKCEPLKFTSDLMRMGFTEPIVIIGRARRGAARRRAPGQPAGRPGTVAHDVAPLESPYGYAQPESLSVTES